MTALAWMALVLVGPLFVAMAAHQVRVRLQVRSLRRMHQQHREARHG